MQSSAAFRSHLIRSACDRQFGRSNLKRDMDNIECDPSDASDSLLSSSADVDLLREVGMVSLLVHRFVLVVVELLPTNRDPRIKKSTCGVRRLRYGAMHSDGQARGCGTGEAEALEVASLVTLLHIAETIA